MSNRVMPEKANPNTQVLWGGGPVEGCFLEETPLNRHDTPQARSSGFTLMEMVVVVFLIAVGAGVAAGVNYRTSESMQLRSAGRELKSFFGACRSVAMAGGYAMGCTYFPEEKRLASGTKSYSLPDGMTLASQSPDPDEDPLPLEDEAVIAVFYPDGSAGGGIFALMGEKRRIYLVLDPLFGTIRVTPTLEEQ